MDEWKFDHNNVNLQRRLDESCTDIDNRRTTLDVTRFLDRQSTFRCLHYDTRLDHDIVLDS